MLFRCLSLRLKLIVCGGLSPKVPDTLTHACARAVDDVAGRHGGWNTHLKKIVNFKSK